MHRNVLLCVAQTVEKIEDYFMPENSATSFWLPISTECLMTSLGENLSLQTDDAANAQYGLFHFKVGSCQ
jgi:hypothetical protein